MIRTGGNPGNKGGVGATPNVLRTMLRDKAFEKFDSYMAQWDEMSIDQQGKALDMMFARGVPAQTESYNAAEGQQVVTRFLDGVVDWLRKDGRVPDADIDRMCKDVGALVKEIFG